jgi:hypothetical protein
MRSKALTYMDCFSKLLLLSPRLNFGNVTGCHNAKIPGDSGGLLTSFSSHCQNSLIQNCIAVDVAADAGLEGTLTPPFLNIVARTLSDNPEAG